MRVVAAILAAGRGERFGGDKMGPPLGGKPVWRHAFDTFRAHPRISGVGVVMARLETIPEAAFVAVGGEDRQESSRIATERAEAEIVLIQDGARPFTSPELIDRVLEAIERTGAAAPGAPVTDTIRVSDGAAWSLVDRDHAVAMQTPQGARRELLMRAHGLATEVYTDEMELLAAAGIPFEIVPGDRENGKITTPDDFLRARAMLETVETRTGIGYDIHRFSTEPDRPLMLGGLRFEGLGLEGHSDADVILHAAVDALLGAAALGDIGQLFPNDDPRWKDADSIQFLRRARALVAEQGWRIVHLDVAMIGERPRIMGRSAEMRAAMAAALQIEPDRVSVKATTNEGLGSLGRGEGIAAHAVATLARSS